MVDEALGRDRRTHSLLDDPHDLEYSLLAANVRGDSIPDSNSRGRLHQSIGQEKLIQRIVMKFFYLIFIVEVSRFLDTQLINASDRL